MFGWLPGHAPPIQGRAVITNTTLCPAHAHSLKFSETKKERRKLYILCPPQPRKLQETKANLLAVSFLQPNNYVLRGLLNDILIIKS